MHINSPAAIIWAMYIALAEKQGASLDQLGGTIQNDILKEFIAQNEAEKTIFRLCAQDESRHVGFGVMHLRYVLEHTPERREEIHHYLDRAEQLFGHPTDGGNTGLQEALLITMSGDGKDLDKGAELALALNKKQANEYMHRLEVAGLGDRRERMNPAFGMLLDPPKN